MQWLMVTKTCRTSTPSTKTCRCASISSESSRPCRCRRLLRWSPTTTRALAHLQVTRTASQRLARSARRTWRPRPAVCRSRAEATVTWKASSSATAACQSRVATPWYELQRMSVFGCPCSLIFRASQLLVGYNDAFLTRDGFTGGLIVKNSWSDGPTQGSHSLAYWMQEHSDWEERTVCPNSHK